MSVTDLPSADVEPDVDPVPDTPAVHKKAQALLDEADSWAEQLTSVWTRLLRREKKVIREKLSGSKARANTKFWDWGEDGAPEGFEFKALDIGKWMDKGRWLDELEEELTPVFERLYSSFLSRGQALFDEKGREEPAADSPISNEIKAPRPRARILRERRDLARLTAKRISEAREYHEAWLDRLAALIDEVAARDAVVIQEVLDAIEIEYTKAEGEVGAVSASQATAAVNDAQLQVVQRSGLKGKKVWFTAMDERVRPSHRKVHGQRRDLTKPFKVPHRQRVTDPWRNVDMQYPGDRSGPVSEWINCRCVLLFYPATTAGEPEAGLEAAARWANLQSSLSLDITTWLEEKGLLSRIARVRTEKGKKKYGQEIGTIIKPDLDLTDRPDFNPMPDEAIAALKAAYSYRDTHTNLTVTVVDWKVTYPSKDNPRARRIDLLATIRDEDDLPRGTIQNTIWPDADPPSVLHGLIQLDDRWQGKGFGERFLQHEERQYLAAGVRHIDLLAGLQVGGYAWARLGFDWRMGGPRAPWFDVKRTLYDFLMHHSDYHVAPGDVQLIEQALEGFVKAEGGQQAPPTPYDIAMLGRDTTPPGQKWVGKEIMQRSHWEARKTLVPAMAMKAAPWWEDETRARRLKHLADQYLAECEDAGWELGEDGVDWTQGSDEAKALRRVRTPAGSRRYGAPIGSPITGDSLSIPPIPHLDPGDYRMMMDALARPRDPNDPRPPAVIFDRDGTLASVPKAPITGTPEAWNEYNAALPFDRPVPRVEALLRAVPEGVVRIMTSGRAEGDHPGDRRRRFAMQDWIAKHDLPIDVLLMRTGGDMRRDSVVKEEILNGEIAHRFDVRFAVDDRPQVVEVWQRNGIPTLQVEGPDLGFPIADRAHKIKQLTGVLEGKLLRYVRTREGVERFNQPINTPILPGRDRPIIRPDTIRRAPGQAPRISTVVPTNVGNTHAPGRGPRMSADLIADKMVADTLRRQAGMPGFEDFQGRTDRAAFDEIIERMADNIVAAVDRSFAISPEATRQHANWYPFANQWLTGLVDEMNARPGGGRRFTPAAAFAATAALSPGADWANNVAWAKHLMETIRDEENIVVDKKWVDAWLAAQVERWENSSEANRAKKPKPTFPDGIVGKKLSQLDSMQAAIAIRGRYNVEGLNQLNHAAGFGDTAYTANPNSNLFIAKAVSVLRNPSLENIDEQLGEEHKVRSFYENIAHPFDADDLNVTADVHHYSVANGVPLAVNNPFMKSTNVSVHASPYNAESGVRGTYPLIVEATRLAAARINEKYGTEWFPNQVQSVAWEQMRAEFSKGFKKKHIVDAIYEVQSAWARGEIDDETRWRRLEEVRIDKGAATPDEIRQWYEQDLADGPRMTLLQIRKMNATAAREAAKLAAAEAKALDLSGYEDERPSGPYLPEIDGDTLFDVEDPRRPLSPATLAHLLEQTGLTAADYEQLVAEMSPQWANRDPESVPDGGIPSDLEEKAAIRRVRTPEGARKYGVPIGSPIIGVDPAQPVTRMMRRLVHQGGFTIHPTGAEPKKGFAVAVGGKSSITKADDFFSSRERAIEIVDAWLKKYADTFDDPRVHIGGWYDRKNDEIVFDPSEVVDDLDEARKLGVNRNEQAVYDLEHGEEIPTGGTGQREEHGLKHFLFETREAGRHGQAPEEGLGDDRRGAAGVRGRDRRPDVRTDREEELGHKGEVIRRVRTPEGAEVYDQPIGSIIRPDFIPGAGLPRAGHISISPEPDAIPDPNAPREATFDADRLDRFEAEVERLNKIAARLKVAPITWTEVERGTRKESSWDNLYADGADAEIETVTVSITGESPRLPGGWTYLGSIEDLAGGPGEPGGRLVHGDDPRLAEFRHIPMDCEYCNKTRDRRKLIVLQNDEGKLTRVGTSCLKDFLGYHGNPERVAWLRDQIRGSLFAEEEEPEWYKVDPWEIPTDVFLELSAAAVRVFGWVPKSSQYGTPTAQRVQDILNPPSRMHADYRDELARVKITDADKEKAATVRAWAAEQSYSDNYLGNLRTTLGGPRITLRGYGIAASAIGAWERAMGIEEERRRKREAEKLMRASSDWVGTVGERGDFSATITAKIPYESEWGTGYVIKMVDDDGNILKTFTSGRWRHQAEVGKRMVFKATVKGHDTWRDTKETNLTRVGQVTWEDEEKGMAWAEEWGLADDLDDLEGKHLPGEHDQDAHGRRGSVPSLSLEDRISVAEEVMERSGLVGRTIDVPAGHLYHPDPEKVAAITPLVEWAREAAASEGYDGWLNLYADQRQIDRETGAQAFVDGNTIVLPDVTNEMTILHEVAHVVTNTDERGHVPRFVQVADRLYRRYLGAEAADTFWNIASRTPEMQGVDRLA